MAARLFDARPSTDKYGGGAGRQRYFFLQLTNGRLAELVCEDREPNQIQLHLKVREGGRVDWEDYEEVMGPLSVAPGAVVRYGGAVWRWRRKPSPQNP